MRVVSYILGLRQGDGKLLAGSSYTLTCFLSMHRSNLEAGKKQAKRSLEYGYSMAKLLFYPSLGASLVFLWSSFGDSKDTRYIHGGCMDVTWRMFAISTEVSRSCNGYVPNVYSSKDLCSSVNKVGFVLTCFFYWSMKLCSFLDATNFFSNLIDVSIQHKMQTNLSAL